jgi:uncharacterized protein (TIGR00266 family)
MQSKITGTILPVLQIGLEAGDTLVAETGQLSWMTPNVQLHTTTSTGGSSGFWGAVTRAASGGGLFMAEFSAPNGPGMVAFAAKVPGLIQPVEVQPGRGYLIHKHGFLCATRGVELSTGFQRSLGAGIFGGDGFLLQKLSGSCSAWVELGGEVVSYDLTPGESLNVHPGHVGMFEDSVTFDITTIPGIRNVLFGGDGLFMARLTGPGKIWLQTLTMPNLAHALSPYLRGEAAAPTPTAAVEGGIAGAVLGSIFGRP